ncbi:venom phosphodiesterase 2-like [Dendronephthya gigantea]|uniref:venom phosphodiesterase 2-like n=1 Tax=Dendronephthya gigantea TaxID=151771 RepID=UPI00106B5909|nr:venom phosphodiesterase 2-like [Dendronephthya gigantea]
MTFDTKGEGDTEAFEVTMVPEEKKGGQGISGKKTLIFAIAAIIVLIIIIAVCLGVILSSEKSNKVLPARPIYPIILISADGFRPDYLTRGLTPNIMKLAKSGVRAKFLLPQFPTKTFPNHFTTVTGLYPESHGIVFNSFYDPVLRKRFSIRFSRNPAFWSGEPIWVTANKSSLKSASYYWVGSEVEGMRPNYYFKYNQTVPFNDRVEQVLKWLQLPMDERPSFITLYFHEPDYSGHGYGPDSSKVEEQIQVIDNTIGLLIKGLENMKISDSVDIILLSDHGMAAVNCSDTIFLDQYNVSASELYITNYGSVLSFNNKKKYDREKVFNMIKCRNNSFQSFYKTDLPKRLHFSKNRRIDDVLVLADPGEIISVDSSEKNRCRNRGTHGYDYIFPYMRPIFIASGPSFLKGKVVEHFSNLEIYNLLANLLQIKPAPNNGTIGSLNRLLVPDARAVVQKSKGDGSVLRTDICKFPNDEVFDTRSKNGLCASCTVPQKDVNKTNMFFNIPAKEARLYEEEHLPWGLPDGGVYKDLGCLLIQQYFIIGYSIYLRIPLWTAHRINGTELLRSDDTKDCYRSDVRLSEDETASCTSYNNSGYDPGKLVSSRDMNFNNFAMLSTSTLANIAPMYPVFEKGIWTRLENIIREWAIKYSIIHVITGTIFDVDGDGLKDKEISNKRRTHTSAQNPAIPTHFYKIVTRCDTNTTAEYDIEKCSGTLRVISFILQHRNESCQFQSYNKIILQNVAPVRDIELLTGINFFPKLPAQLQVELKTFIPVELWA